MYEYRNIEQEKIEGSSDKSFGIVFAIVFAIIAFWPLIWGNNLRIWSAIIAAVFLFFAFVFPQALTPLNKVWTKFGLFLHKIVTPLVMGLVFFVVVTPIGLLMRLLGKRTLELKFSEQPSYWIERKPPGPEPESFNNQF